MSSSTTDVTMPQMGVSVTEGTVIAWAKQPGDEVQADETICEISTDKIDTDLPAPAAGTLAEILVPVGQTVPVGTTLARIENADRAGGAIGDASAAPGAEAPRSTTGPARSHARLSPVVQRIAQEHNIDATQVRGTGRGGRVRKQDVLAQIERRPDTLSRIRRTIGEHMKRSLDTAATCTTWMEADMTRVEASRKTRGLTALPIVARCTIDALRELPALNATLDGERYERSEDVNLGIAVSLGEDGLIVPVIHRAQELSAEGLATRIKELARRARANDLNPDDVRGGTFTITNPGQFGSLMATPIINQPQVAILDLEAIVKRPVVVTGDDGQDMIAIRPQTILGLSWDHRALDGALAAQFLAAVRRRIEAWHG